ncbi:hypothetical protein HETIRDRAFT_423631 [Heterobasidion irregulare TC 32-1]|uniref:Uncharacterized protein n=1 Tax=Heterobasidion irregulare (strain TC 32-1) TaxID=747525 RepID=W4JNK5_HETIT|nr:uncharacterized protein HETIRDRAFT_423631 [Heterobasidion irregulare TC 32-1]ETW75064.1 hypothetical protein HETIRDRAFT_423631 [Heterobasidion irregulare TC 32-1]
MANMYHGWLGARFPGQDSTDLHFTDYGPAGPDIKRRQHNLCIALGISFAYPEQAAAAGAPWFYDAPTVPFMEFMDYGLAPPLVPVLGPGVLVPVSFAVTNGGVDIGFNRFIMSKKAMASGESITINILRRHGHDPADTPTIIVGAGAKHRVCSAVVYSAQVQEYRRARNL